MSRVELRHNSLRFRVDLGQDPPLIERWDPAHGWQPWEEGANDHRGERTQALIDRARALAL